MADDSKTTTDEEFEAGDESDNIRKVKVRLEDGSIVIQPLPPITSIVIPKTATKSATIRWLGALGYQVKEIYPFLGVKYQMVRNILTNIPKRAAREDTPDVIIEYKPEKDMLDEAMDGALEQSLMAGRKDRKKAQREELRAQGLED